MRTILVNTLNDNFGVKVREKIINKVLYLLYIEMTKHKLISEFDEMIKKSIIKFLNITFIL